MKLFSTEQVSKYHPDKLADRISDTLLAEYLSQDPNAKCGIETMVKDDTVVVSGEVNSTANIDKTKLIKEVMDEMNYKLTNIIDLINIQSPEINKAVTSKENLGAGDQGIMFGYATSDNENYLPNGFNYANRVIEALEKDIATNTHTILKGDAKCQITVDLDNVSASPKVILISVCHNEGLSLDEVKDYIINIMKNNKLYFEDTAYIINPAGTWNVGGPVSDAGLTGRKIVCDQYGGYIPVGGGAFSGKDLTKVDRSASYMARIIAVDLLKKYDLKECMIELAYGIGVEQPISVYVKTDRDDTLDIEVLKQYINNTYDLTPRGMIKYLNLKKEDYIYLSGGNHMEKIIKIMKKR